MSLIKIYLLVTFLSTGQEVKYQFDTMANCNAAKPPVAELYKALGDKVKISCVKLQE